MPDIRADCVDVFAFRPRLCGGVEFLLLLRAADDFLGDTWQPVSGCIEPGETAVAAALRELCEEAGVTPRRFWQLNYLNAFFVAAFDRVVLAPTFAAEIDPAANITLCDEHTAFRWIDQERIDDEVLWPNHRTAMRQVLDEILKPGPAEPFLRIAPPPA